MTASECNLAAPLPPDGPVRRGLPAQRPHLLRPADQAGDPRAACAQLMRPDGWLFLGAAETTLGVDDSWERVVLGRTSAYRPLKGA